MIVAVPSPFDTELSVSCGDSGLPTPFACTVAAAPDALPPSPGGSSKRE